MAKTTHRASAGKQAERMKQAMRQARLLKVKQAGQPLIPANVLKRLAALNLPPNPWVYETCLKALLQEGA